MKVDNNTMIYDALKVVPENAKKKFRKNNKLELTDINPMWRIKAMTEKFGPCGVGWYFSAPEKEMVHNADGSVCVFVSLDLFINLNSDLSMAPVWSAPIHGEGGNTYIRMTKDGLSLADDEAYKMAYTDAQSNACKLLGLGADVWFEADKTKYTKEQSAVIKVKPDPAILKRIQEIDDINELRSYYKSINLTQQELVLDVFKLRSEEIKAMPPKEPVDTQAEARNNLVAALNLSSNAEPVKVVKETQEAPESVKGKAFTAVTAEPLFTEQQMEGKTSPNLKSNAKGE